MPLLLPIIATNVHSLCVQTEAQACPTDQICGMLLIPHYAETHDKRFTCHIS